MEINSDQLGRVSEMCDDAINEIYLHARRESCHLSKCPLSITSC